MRTPVDERLRSEVERFSLRYQCEHCAYFDAAREACSEGFPVEEHRARSLDVGSFVVFCKRFEVG